jgi:hypothetical protein
MEGRSSGPRVFIDGEHYLLSDHPGLLICSHALLPGYEEIILTGPLSEAAAKLLPWQGFVKLICSSSLRELAPAVKLPWQ